MTLAVILTQKSRDTITAAPTNTLREVATILGEKGIGAVLITDGDRNLLGIVSERDIVRVIARNGAKSLDDQASAHMTARVVTATPQTSVAEAMAFMTDGRFRHIPVMHEGQIAGLVSIGDLVKHRLSEMESENKALHDYIAAA